MKLEIENIDISKSLLQKSLKQIAYILITGLILFTFYKYQNLPDQIPKHFNIKGEVDSYASKQLIWVVLSIFIGLNILLSYMMSKPQWINYPFKITEKNAQAQFNNVLDMTSMINVLLNIMGWLLIWMMVDYQSVQAYGTTWLPACFLFIILATTTYYLYKGYKLS
jgi:uncharacterized membrane protein